jgi:hypothetical protein
MQNSPIPSTRIRAIIVLCVLFPCAAVTLADDAAVPRRANDGQLAAPPGQVGRDKQTKSAVKPNAAEAHPNYILQVIDLHYIRAEAALPIVRDIFVAKGSDSWMRPRFAVDEVKNRLIAWGDRETMREVLALILRLDQQGSSSPSEPQTKTFEFRYIEPNAAQKAVRELGLTGLTSVADSRTKSLIVNGRKDAVDRVAKLVHVLDVPPPESRAADASIRVVWLVDKSLATDETPPLPSDLVDAVAGLRKKMGIGELRLATQMIANIASTGDSNFDLSGTAVQNFHLEMIGTLTRNGAESRLNVDFSATRGDRNGQRPMCSLNTTCSGLVPGRPVIVGMTTVNSQPSVLVIELLPK